MKKNKVYNDDIAVYKKKKNSNTSKAAAKTKHKHVYKPCLLERENKFFFTGKIKQCRSLSKGTYCAICGKIGDARIININDNMEDILEKYKDIPLFKLDDYFQKYVMLPKNENVSTKNIIVKI